ncbi:hypothetical protein AB7C87_18480 [Natrarchaeobius sp. A-rgal3]
MDNSVQFRTTYNSVRLEADDRNELEADDRNELEADDRNGLE